MKSDKHFLPSRLFFKKVCDIASLFFYGDKDQGHWLYEKIQKPDSYFNEMINLYYYAARIPRLYRAISVSIEPVFGCNLNCRYCWKNYPPHADLGAVDARPHFMPRETFRKALKDIPGSVESVCLTGLGEPLLHPEICDMLEFTIRQGLRTSIYTNGTLLKGTLLNRLAALPVSVVNISIEPDKKTLGKYRGVDFESLTKNIREFLSKKQVDTQLKFSLVAHAGNVNSLDQRQAVWGQFSTDFKVVRQAIYNRPVVFNKCLEPWLGNPVILTSGDVCLCCHAVAWPIVAGNINERPLDKIMNSAIHRDILKRFITQREVPNICSWCGQFEDDRSSFRFLKK